MIRAACLVIVLAAPAMAQRASETERCNKGWQHLAGMIIGYQGDGLFDFTMPDELLALRDTAQKPLVDGWCQAVSMGNGPLSQVEKFAWRAAPADFADDRDGLPSALAFRVSGTLRQNGRSEAAELSLQLSHSPEDGLLIIDSLTSRIDDAAVLNASAVIGGAYFDDPRAAQMSLLGLHLDQLALTAMLETAQASLLKDISRDDVAEFVRGLSFAQMDRRSRSEALDFGRALPAPNGMLDLKFASDRGLGWMQVGVATNQDDADMPGFLLDGAQLSVDWQPN
jgi:hypothetical protein